MNVFIFGAKARGPRFTIGVKTQKGARILRPNSYESLRALLRALLCFSRGQPLASVGRVASAINPARQAERAAYLSGAAAGQEGEGVREAPFSGAHVEP
jgi:hypothetical protein